MLRNLFAIARATDRIPIIPQLECHCDRYWYPIVNTCRSPGAELGRPFFCTLDMLFPLNLWRDQSFQWREHSFLAGERVPTELHTSVVQVQVVPRPLAWRGNSSSSWQLPAFSTDSELRTALHPLKEVRVLSLSSAHDAFCAFEDKEENKKFDNLMGIILQEIWCCHNNGSLSYDVPPPLFQAIIVKDKCTPSLRSMFPHVAKAHEIEYACRSNEKCMKWNTIALDSQLIAYGKISKRHNNL